MFPRPKFVVYSVCTPIVIAVISCLPTTASAEPLLPNLSPLPAYDFFYQPDFGGTGAFIRFSVTASNKGAGPLEIRGGDVGAGGQEVLQSIYHTDGTRIDRPAGTFEFHPAHNHIHLEGFAEYSLTPAGSPGVNPVVGAKTSFCLMDTTKTGRHLANAAKKAVYTECETSVQGISVGWGDTYAYTLPGQLLEITSVASGEYDLIVTVDPEGNLSETNESDNVSTVRIAIDKVAGTVRLAEDEKPCRGKKCR